MSIRQFVLWHIAPPHGMQVRRLVTFMTLAIAVPRILQALPFGMSLVWLHPSLYGWMFLALAVALMITSWRGRFSVPGRMIAAAGAILYAIAAADAASRSTTSMLVNLAMAYALLGEAASINDCD